MRTSDIFKNQQPFIKIIDMQIPAKVDLVKFFVTAARSDSFRQAAFKLDTTPQTVSRSIKELEQSLGEILFYRNTRSISITTFGKTLLPECERLLESINNIFIKREPHSEGNKISGVVKITAPTFLGRNFIYRKTAYLIEKYNNLCLDFKFTDHIEDFIKSGIDIGIRVGSIEKNSYIARKIGRVKFDVVIATHLHNRIKNKKLMSEIIDEPVVLMRDSSTGELKNWLDAKNNIIKFKNIRMISNDSETLCQAICDGIGIAQIPEVIAREFYAKGEMKKIDINDVVSELDIYIYRPQSGPVADRVRLVYDELIKQSENF